MSVLEDSECPDVEKDDARQQEIVCVERGQSQLYPRVTIDALPDDVLLEIFSFDLDQPVSRYTTQVDRDRWQTLVHICQRWRYLVFASPRRLNLQIRCTASRSVKKMLCIWPKFPIVIDTSEVTWQGPGPANTVAALKQRNRVSSIHLHIPQNILFEYLVKMKKPFPVLTDLTLLSKFGWERVLPESFLGGSTPRLRSLTLQGIPFPALGKLLLTTPDLVHLDLRDVPHSGYISPEAIVACLSVLARLQILSLGFRSPQFYINRTSRPSPPLRHVVLPALTLLSFQGHSEYLENIVSQIDAPLLNSTSITFLDQPVSHTPRLRHFISGIEAFKTLRQAVISIHRGQSKLVCTGKSGEDSDDTSTRQTLCLSCKSSDQHTWSLIQVLGSSFPLFSDLESLSIYEFRMHRQDVIDYTQWRELLHLFRSVKDLELCGYLVKPTAALLTEVRGERVIEVLPALQNIFVERRPSPALAQVFEQFAAARQLSGRPVVIHYRRR